MEAEVMEKRSRTASTSSLMHDPSSPLSAEEREKRRAEAIAARGKALEDALEEDATELTNELKSVLPRKVMLSIEDFAKVAEEDAKPAVQAELRRHYESDIIERERRVALAAAEKEQAAREEAKLRLEQALVKEAQLEAAATAAKLKLEEKERKAVIDALSDAAAKQAKAEEREKRAAKVIAEKVAKADNDAANKKVHDDAKAKVDALKQATDARLTKLREVYRQFDLDGGGDVGFDEMLALGQVRRDVGKYERRSEIDITEIAACSSCSS